MENMNKDREPVVPNFIKNRSEQNEVDALVNQVHAEYYAAQGENEKVLSAEEYDELSKNSVGTGKTKKVFVKVILPLAFVATLLGRIGWSNYKIEEAKQSYFSDMYIYDEGEMHSSYIEHNYNFDYMGLDIAGKITNILGLIKTEINEPGNKKVDPNYEVLKALGLAVDEVLEYTTKHNVGNAIDESSILGWAEEIYSGVRDELKELGIIELPFDFSDFLKANGFGDKKLYFDHITGMIHCKYGVETDSKDMLRNLMAYAKFHVINGREPETTDLIEDLVTRGGR